MHCTWFTSTFLRVFKFQQIKEWGSNFWGEPILQKVWIIWSPLLRFHFKSSMDPNFSSFIIFQCILLDSGVLFWEFSNFYKLPRGDLISGRNQFWRKSELFGTPIVYFNFKSFKNGISSSFIRFQWGRGTKFLRGNQFCRKSEWFGPPFCIFILKVLWTQIFRHSLYFNAFCLIQEYFSRSFRISTNYRGGT